MHKKKKALFKNPVIWFFAGAFLLFFVYKIITPIEISKPVKFIYYPDFGIELPVGYMIHGIDVSRHQENINWDLVSAVKQDNISIQFAFIKATEGIITVDKNYKKNWMNANNAGIVCGAYHYFIATKSGKDQAKNFIKTVILKPGNLPPVIDVEELYGANPVDMRLRMKDWINLVEENYHVKPIIYTSADFFNQYLDGYFKDYPLWVAHYFEKDKPRVSAAWIFWQHNNTGHVNGISEKVDFNVFNGDSTAFQNILIK
ncbi:MAG: GH25 family lysozyme [Chitinophagaceae bacterium]